MCIGDFDIIYIVNYDKCKKNFYLFFLNIKYCDIESIGCYSWVNFIIGCIREIRKIMDIGLYYMCMGII